MTVTVPQCPLCGQLSTSLLFHSDQFRDYYRCLHCSVIFVPASMHLNSLQEKREYDQHQNSPDDAGYRTFLNQLFTPLEERIAPASHGLDFGSGPGPTLSVMFEEAGHTVALYDPFYAPSRDVLSSPYDFISSSEVVEHFRQPAVELELLWSLLKPGGWLGVMTGMALDQKAFAGWRYKNDRTHITFFSVETMLWLAGKWQAELVFPGGNVSLFRKHTSHGRKLKG